MGKNKPFKRILKITGICIAILIALFISYILVCSFIIPGEFVTTTSGEPYTSEEISEFSKLFDENGLQYWLTPEKNGILVTWGQQQKACDLLEKNKLGGNGLSPRSYRWLLGYYPMTARHIDIWLHYGPNPDGNWE